MSVAEVTFSRMSKTKPRKQPRKQPVQTRMGRKPITPSTERGREILARLAEKGLGVMEAAEQAGLSYNVLFRAIHDAPERMTMRTAYALHERLGLPLSLVAPQLAR